MWLCEGKLKVKTAHFRLPSASQKRLCLSSLFIILITVLGWGQFMQDSRKTDSPCRFGLPQEILFKHSFVIYKPTDLSNGRLLITVNDYTNKTSLLACGVLSVVKTLQVTYSMQEKQAMNQRLRL